MAGVEFKGLDQLKRDFKDLELRIGAEVVIAAEDAAAEVFKAAILAATPVLKSSSRSTHPSGQLRSSVTIIESKDRKLTGVARRGLFVGLEKRKGFYGFFIDQGFTAMGRAGRKKRYAGVATRKGGAVMHSQSGSTGGKWIPGTNWFASAVRSAMAAATAAYESAFSQKCNEVVK